MALTYLSIPYSFQIMSSLLTMEQKVDSNDDGLPTLVASDDKGLPPLVQLTEDGMRLRSGRCLLEQKVDSNDEKNRKNTYRIRQLYRFVVAV
jgi:hypothetical protein